MELVGALEIDPPTAQVYADNLGADHLTIGDVCNFDFRQWYGLYFLHASPSCKPHAFGSANGRPQDHPQHDSAYAVVRALKECTPRIFTLENSPNFARSEPCAAIMSTLHQLGYTIHSETLNAVDFGVPQERKRRIIIAVRGGHGVLLQRLPWVGGWSAALSDLVDDLSPIAPSLAQQPALKKIGNHGRWLVQRSGVAYRKGQPAASHRHAKEPSFAVRAFGRGCDGHGPDQANIWDADQREMLELTPRCYARLMGIPDSYQLPDDDVLAVEVLGNGFPPPFARAVFDAALRSAGVCQREVA
jgi:DNA (cytosine-5)-methyltransferase 1